MSEEFKPQVISLEEVERLKKRYAAEAELAKVNAKIKEYESGVNVTYRADKFMSGVHQNRFKHDSYMRDGVIRQQRYENLFNVAADSYTVINNLIMPPTSQRCDWKVIEETLVRNTACGIQAYIQSATSLDVGLYAYTTKEQLMDLKYQMSRIYENLDSITNLVVACTSNYMLGSMLYYVDRSHMFMYIRESIIRPNIKNFIALAKANLMDEDMSMDLADAKAELQRTVDDYIYATLISVDTKKMQSSREKLLKYRDRFYNDLDAAFAPGEYLMPRFMIDLILFTSSAEEVKAYDDFLKFMEVYKVSLTLESNRSLFRDYCDPDIRDIEFEKKLRHTIKKRNESNGLYFKEDQLIDGITFDEMNMIARACTGRLDPEDRAMLNGTRYAKRVFELIDQYGGINYSWYLKEGKLGRRDNFTKKEVLYDIKTDKFDIDVNDDIRRFPEFIKNALYKNPNVGDIPECFLHQTGYVVNSMTEPEAIEKLLTAYKTMDKKEKIQQRTSTIHKYMLQTRKFDPDRVDYLQGIITDFDHNGFMGPIGPEWEDIKTNPIICETTEELIEKLCIIEGMWRLLSETQERRKKRLAELTYQEYDPKRPIDEQSERVQKMATQDSKFTQEILEERRAKGIPDLVTIPRIPASKEERNAMLDAEISRLRPQGMLMVNGILHPNVEFLTNVTNDIYYDKGRPPLRPITPRKKGTILGLSITEDELF